MLASDEHVKKCIELGADFIVLGGNPGSGTSIKDVVETAKRIKQKYKDKIFVFAGKWEGKERHKPDLLLTKIFDKEY